MYIISSLKVNYLKKNSKQNESNNDPILTFRKIYILSLEREYKLSFRQNVSFFPNRWNRKRRNLLLLREQSSRYLLLYDRKVGNKGGHDFYHRLWKSPLNLLPYSNNSNEHPIRNETFIEKRRKEIDDSSSCDDGGDVNKEACTLWKGWVVT